MRQVTFMSDESPASQEVEAGLRKRKVPYKTISADSIGGDIILPAVQEGSYTYYGIPSIQLYLFDQLDKRSREEVCG